MTLNMRCKDCDFLDIIKFENGKSWKCPNCEFNQPERSKREDRYNGGYFPPPWNPNEHPEKTEGWIAFQEEQRKDPKYYGCGALNTVETQ